MSVPRLTSTLKGSKLNRLKDLFARFWYPEKLELPGLAMWGGVGAGVGAATPDKGDRSRVTRAILGALAGAGGYGGAVLGTRGLRGILSKLKTNQTIFGRPLKEFLPAATRIGGGVAGTTAGAYATRGAGEKLMDTKEAQEKTAAFRLGFILKLAEERISPSELWDKCAQMEKRAKRPVVINSGSSASKTSPLSVGTGLATFGSLGLLGGIAAPRVAGTALGGLTSVMSDEEIDTLSQAKKKYLIKKLRRLIREVKVKNDNRMISQVKREVPA